MSDQLRSLLGMKPEPLICRQTANTPRPTAEQEHNSPERKRNSLDRLFARHLQRGRNSPNQLGTIKAPAPWQPSREADAEARSPTAESTGEATGEATAEATGEATAEATGEATAEAATHLPAEVQKMLKVLAEPITRQVIMQLRDVQHEMYFRTAYIAPALHAQVVELTIPDNSTSPNQKYRLIAKCVAMRPFLLDPPQGSRKP